MSVQKNVTKIVDGNTINVEPFPDGEDSIRLLGIDTPETNYFGHSQGQHADEYREEKIVGETRIPAGTYNVTLRKEGGHHNKYKRRFPDIHRGMLHILDVPNFKWILIHCGNTDEDTAGCLLVGSQAITDPGDMKIISSAAAYKRFYPMVVDAAGNGTLTITYEDNDH